MKDQTEFRTIRYNFTAEEQAKHSTELAEACKIKQETEADKKSTMSQFKAKIDAQDSRIGLLSKYITTGYDYRTKECIVKLNFTTSQKEYYFEGELIETVAMTAEDHQLRIQEA